MSQSGLGFDLPITGRRDSLFLDHEKQFESRIPSGISFYGQDPALPTVHSSSGLLRTAVPIVTQVCFYVCLNYYYYFFNSFYQNGKEQNQRL